MHRSDGVRAAMLQLYQRFSEGDPDAFAELIEKDDAALVIGTDAAQWEEGYDTWVAAFRSQMESLPGIRLESGDIRAYEEGSMGWTADRPSFVLPDGSALPARLTGVLRKEGGGGWRVVHCHFSFGVPDARLEELAPVLFG